MIAKAALDTEALPKIVCSKCSCRSYCVEHREESAPIITCYRCGETVAQ